MKMKNPCGEIPLGNSEECVLPLPSSKKKNKKKNKKSPSVFEILERNRLQFPWTTF